MTNEIIPQILPLGPRSGDKDMGGTPGIHLKRCFYIKYTMFRLYLMDYMRCIGSLHNTSSSDISSKFYACYIMFTALQFEMY